MLRLDIQVERMEVFEMKIALRVGLVVAVVAAGVAWYVFDKVMTGEMAYAAAAVAVGQDMPDFKMKDVNGTEHTMEGRTNATFVLVFSSQECPWSRGADPGLTALATEYLPKGVAFYAIDSHKDTTVEQMKNYAMEARIPYPLLKDEGNAYADLVGAKVTPEIFIVSKEGKLVYHGAFDNRMSPDAAGDQAYVKMALDAVLEGKPVEQDRVKAWGCSIKRKG
jgi:thiol-disulfide isomerase/thioredoxin